MKKLTILLLLLYISTLGVLAEPIDTAADPTPTPVVESQPYSGSAEITILHTSDIHGNFQRNKETGAIGYSGIAAIQRSLPNSILVDSGDYLTSNLFQAQDTVSHVLSLMNAVGYHVAGIGEADLLNGTEVLRNVQSQAAFHMLSSNVTTGTDRNALLGNTQIIEVQGVKLGFFSIISPELRLSSGLAEITDIYLEDASKTAQACVNSLKQQGADVIIALSHIGNEGNTKVDQLAAFVSGIDFILDGHSHQEENGKFIGDTMILNPGANGKKVLQLNLKFGGNKSLLSISVTQWNYEATEKLEMDQAIMDLENQIIAEQSAFMNESVAVSKVAIDYQDEIQYQSNPLGNFIADAYRAKTNATIALVDADSIGGGISTGEVTKAKILSILPNNDVVQTKKITPKALKTALESGLSNMSLREDGTVDPAGAIGKFPQISGLTVSVNLKNEPGNRVVRIKLDTGVQLNLSDDRSTLMIASNSRILSGQNDYDIFSMYEVNEEFCAEGQALLDYMNSAEEYPDYTQSRIQVTEKQKSYAGIIITMLLGLLLMVMVLVVVIKIITRVA